MIAVSVSAVVTVKRFWLGMYLGKKTYTNYSQDLKKVTKKMLFLTEIAALASRLRNAKNYQSVRQLSVSRFGMSREEVRVMLESVLSEFLP